MISRKQQLAWNRRARRLVRYFKGRPDPAKIKVKDHENSLHEDKYISCFDLNDRHVGETIFIIGAGPQLAELSGEQIRSLENKITIGVNWTTYKIRPTYFISPYIAMILLGQLSQPESIFIHMRKEYEEPLHDFILPIKWKRFVMEDENATLPRRFEPPEPCILWRANSILAATSLAYIMGAKRLVYIGVQQEGLNHFYDFDESIKAQIISDLYKIKNVSCLDIDHPGYAWEDTLAYVNKAPFAKYTGETDCVPYNRQNPIVFRRYFELLQKDSVEIYTTVKKGVINDAGGEYRSLDDFL